MRIAMEYTIEKITANNYCLFDDMVFWRINGFEREPSQIEISEQMKKELENPNLHVYSAMANNRYVGWISLVYIPKIGSRWNGHGHVYVDELWVEPGFRGKGIAKALMKKADELRAALNATGIRLYVNTENPTAAALYKCCGYLENGQAIFMEK